MSFLSTYARTLIKSASEPRYYADILVTKLAFSIKFFLASSALLAILGATWFGLHDLPVVIKAVDTQTTAQLSKLPDNTFITYSNGTLSTKGIPLPYNVTTSDWSLHVGDKTLVVTSAMDDTLTQTLKWSDIWDSGWTLNKTQLEGKQREVITSLHRWSTPAILAAVPFFFFLSIVGNLITLFILGVFMNTLGWLLGIRLTLLKTLQLGLHAIVVANVVDFARQILLPTSSFSLIIPAFLGIMVLVLLTLRSALRAR